MSVKTGLDVLVNTNFSILKGRNIALVCNQASIDSRLQHVTDIFHDAHKEGTFHLAALLGPQHGLWGHTQDNMIEWQGYKDARLGVPVFSLYGEHRKPTEVMLNGVDTLVFDMQDVGAKYYTFIWTLAHCMEACAESDIEVVVLDRPNPIGGEATEGPAENNDFLSFVGLHPITIRHGLTIAEIAKHLQQKYYRDCRLQVVAMENYERGLYFDETGLPWVMPSPNVPVVDTTVVYPGMCLLEATNLSEARGTTRPFELFGAPWFDSWELADGLSKYDLPGIVFRAVEFQPTFHKHAGEVCGGCMMHVTDRQAFKPFLTGIAIIREAIVEHRRLFEWKAPPYEYEYVKMPFDILVGNDWIREMLDKQAPLKEMEDRWEAERQAFEPQRQAVLMYLD